MKIESKIDFNAERLAFIKWAIRNQYDVSEINNINHGVLFKRHSTENAWMGWLYSAKAKAEEIKGCVVVPKEQIETWWQDAEEPENFATTIETIPALGENLSDKEIMEIDEHHTIHLPSKRVYGTWVEKDGERSFVTGSLEECRAAVEAARGGK